MRPPAGRFVIEHFLPGRLRLRLPREADLEGLTEDLKGRAGVLGVTGSPLTGGMLVRFDPGQVAVERVLEVLGAHSLRAQPTETAPPATTLADAVNSAMAALDAKVKTATRNALGLGTLVPIGFLGWAAAELARGRRGRLAWTSAVWYAHGVFRDYNREAPREPPASAAHGD
jgi:hypothetical protein